MGINDTKAMVAAQILVGLLQRDNKLVLDYGSYEIQHEYETHNLGCSSSVDSAIESAVYITNKLLDKIAEG